MSALNLRLPTSVHRHIRDISSHEGVSINQFIVSAVSEKISALTTEEYIASRAKRAGKGAFRRVLDRVPRRAPLPADEIPE
ncbi:MAG: toxin-antitoxin system HicB family antitoxin [Kiritimatiellaeota bacterium]|nr:toxin-antitoxin system HicB family antitoxin [Kiritimatiellota bacterium]